MMEGANEKPSYKQGPVPDWDILSANEPTAIGGASEEITSYVNSGDELVDSGDESVDLPVSPGSNPAWREAFNSLCDELSAHPPHIIPRARESMRAATDDMLAHLSDAVTAPQPEDAQLSAEAPADERHAGAPVVPDEAAPAPSPDAEPVDYAAKRFAYEDGDFSDDYDGSKRVQAAFNDPEFRALDFYEQIEARGFGFQGNDDIPYSDGDTDRFGNPLPGTYAIGLRRDGQEFRASWREPEIHEQEV